MFAFNNAQVELAFGDNSLEIDILHKMYPHKEICILQQVHGDSVMAADAHMELEADAHYTTDRDKVLVIKTADCVPILIYNSVSQCIAAVHAGWRGVAKQIINKSIEIICPTEKEKKLTKIWFGPHIQKQSFEVEIDVVHALQESLNTETNNFFTPQPKNKQKFFVDLSAVIKLQLQAIDFPLQHTEFVETDTFSDSNYFSYRRGSDKQRLYSYITKA